MEMDDKQEFNIQVEIVDHSNSRCGGRMKKAIQNSRSVLMMNMQQNDNFEPNASGLNMN